jgi:hypothetical protein
MSGFATPAGSGGVTVHADLSGLSADDHLQYIDNSPATTARNIIQPADSITRGIALRLSTVTPPSIDPSLVTGMQVWYKADALSLSDNDPVSSWTDSSGNSRSVTQSGSARPTYKTNIINGNPVVRFDGVDDYLTLAQSFISGDSWTIFTVSKSSSGSGPIASNDSAGNRGWVLYRGTTGGNFETGGAAGTGYSASSSFDVVTVRGGIEIYVDGVFNVSATRSIPSNAAPFEVGRRNFGEKFTGDIAEIIIYNRRVTRAERAGIEQYFSDKYALVVISNGNLMELQDGSANVVASFTGEGRFGLGEPAPASQLSVRQNSASVPALTVQYLASSSVNPINFKNDSGQTMICVTNSSRIGMLTDAPSDSLELASGALKVTGGTFKLGDGQISKAVGSGFTLNSSVTSDSVTMPVSSGRTIRAEMNALILQGEINTGGQYDVKCIGKNSAGGSTASHLLGLFNDTTAMSWVTKEGYLSLSQGSLRLLGRTSTSADPTTTELPTDKDLAIHKNTTTSIVYLAYNDGGTIKKVALT